MPCFNPLNIVNPTVAYRSGFDPVAVKVPCGQCDGCRQKNQNDWVVRMYAEYLECTDNGGLVAFPTLTYDNEHLPMWHDVEYNFSESVFSHEDITAFLKKLRTYAFRRFGITDIRYIVFAEYGSNGTYRPHYHVLLFFPPGINDFQICALIRKAWINGFIGWSPCGAFVNNTNALIYCSKYASKDLNFFGKKVIADYVTKIKGDTEKYTLFKQHLPKHYQSKGFGKKYLMRYLQDDKLSHALEHGIRFHLTERVFALPDYIFRSTCYSYNGYGVRYVNEIGAKIISLRQQIQVNKKVSQLKHNLTLIGLNSLVLSKDIADITKGQFNNVVELHQHINNLLNGRSVESLVYYATTYQNRSFRCNPLYIFDNDALRAYDKENIEFYDILASYPLEKFIEYAKSFKYFQLTKAHAYTSRDVPEDSVGRLKLKNGFKEIEQEYYFNTLPQFKDFDYILELYNKIVSHRREINLKQRVIDNAKAKEYKDKFYFNLIV